jgi:hypothetical protein
MYPIVISEDLISKDECDLIVNLAKDRVFSHTPQNVNLPEDPILDNKRIRALHLYSDFEGFSILEDFQVRLNNFVEEKFSTKILSVTSHVLIKYTENQYIDAHRDWEPLDPYVIENNKKQVHLSSVTYFNEDFIGGEICLKEKDIFNSDLMTLAPKAGTTIFIDGGKYHVTKPIMSGAKYSYTKFYTLDV